MKLGQRVIYDAYLYRTKGSKLTWPEIKLAIPKEGIIVGMRTVYEGYTEYPHDYAEFVRTKKINTYLVASNLAGLVYVHPDSVTWVEVENVD